MRRIGCVLLMSAPTPASGRGAPGEVEAGADEARRAVEGRTLREIALEYSPRVEESGTGLVYIDLTGVRGLFGDELAIADGLRRRAAERGLAVRVGIGGSRASARMAARWDGGARVVDPGQEAAALVAAPLSMLDGDPETPALLRRWGLRTLGEVAALPAVALFERLGREGVRVRELAVGLDPRPLAPWRAPRVFEASVNLDWEVAELPALDEVVARLAGEISTGLAREDADAGRLEWSLRLCNRTLHEGELNPAVPTRDPRALAALIRSALRARRPPAAVTGIALRAHPSRMARAQPELTDPLRPNARTLAEVLSRLASLVGDARVGAPVLLDSHRPDAIELGDLRDSPPAHRVSQYPGRGLVGRGLALRRQRPPARAVVRLAAGRPAHLRAGAMDGPVVASVGPWRQSGEWWRPGAWASDEWDAELGDGTLCRLVHDGAGWFLDGVYD